MNSKPIIGEYEYVSPISDRAFRKLFTAMKESEKITASFTNAVLSHDADAQSRKITLLPPDIFGEAEKDRSVIPDVKFKNQKNNRFIIEMQAVDDGSWKERFMLGLSGLYREQISQGQDCGTIKKCFSIQVLNFIKYKNDEKYHRVIRFSDTTEPHMAYSDNDMEMHVIELQKFKKKLNQLKSLLDKWLYFFSSITKHYLNEDIPKALQTPVELKRAILNLQIISLNQEDRKQYYKWLQEMGYIEGVKKDAREKTLQEGIVIGEVKGERKILVDQILYKFSGVSHEEVSSMIEKFSAEQILTLGRKILKAKSLKELLGSQPHELQETAVRRSPRKRMRREIVAM
jgi:predicted transposase/invertase (TIGR01784 family)